MTIERKMIGPTIISIAFLTVMAGAAVSPAVGSIAMAFPNVSSGMIRLVVTLPPLMVIPSALVTGRLSNAIGKKTTLLVGLLLYLIGGVGGGFAGTIKVLLATRALLGLSVGLIMPLSTALVSDFFEGPQATRMMGWISASNNLGGMGAQVLSGILATLCWRYTFGVYAIALLALGMVFFYMPEPRKKEGKRSANTQLPGRIFLYATTMFGVMLLFYTIPVNISLFIEGSGLGNATSSGIACALLTGSAFLVGLGFFRLNLLLEQASMPTAFALMSAGFFIVSVSENLLPVYCGVALVGLGQGYLIPFVFQSVRTHVDDAQSVNAMAIVSIAMYLGQFLSPLVIDSIRDIFLCSSLANSFLVASLLSVAIALLSGIFPIFVKRNRFKANEA